MAVGKLFTRVNIGIYIVYLYKVRVVMDMCRDEIEPGLFRNFGVPIQARVVIEGNVG